MARDELIDSHVSLKQAKKAVDALHAYVSKRQEKEAESQLLGAKEQHVWLNVTVKKLSNQHRLKPTKIPIVHPLVDPRVSRVCLISKDPQREYKDLLETNNIKFISRVVGIAKLKGKFKPFEARRELLKENGLFLADERVIPLLPKLLGSKWFEAKKQPIPVKMTSKDLKGELEKAINSTYMNQNRGTCTSIKVGKMSQTPAQILDNIKTALPAVVKALDGGWENVQSLHIKTNSSTSLPIWSCSLDDSEEGRWHGLKAEDAAVEGTDDEAAASEGEAEKPSTKGSKAGKGRKRSSDSEEEEEKPKKKAKPSANTAPTPAPSSKAPPSTNAKAKKSAPVSKVESEKPTVKKSKATDESASTPKAVAPSKEAKRQSEETVAKAAPPKPEAKTRNKPEAPGTLENKSNVDTTQAEVTSGDKKKKPVSSQPTADAPQTRSKSTPRAGQGTKKGDDTATSNPKTDISTEDIKSKRAANAVEKKKQLVAKSKGGKSIKNAVLGKKVAQE